MRALPAVAVLLTACSGSSTTPPQPDAAPMQPDAAGAALHVPSPVWSDQIIYFVMIDRFANGDRTNDDQHRGELDPSSPDKYSGGDLQGIIDKLDYIQGLGATAVWITPPVANMWWDPLQQSGGYHGYWARDLKKVDEHFGTLDTYKALSRALHARGMVLIQDIVPNHMGNFFQYSSYDPAHPEAGVVKNSNAVPGSKPEQAPFDRNDPTNPAELAQNIYHWTPAIADYNDPEQEASWQISDLDDLNTESIEVRAALRDSYGYWIKEVGVDAFRVDTAKFVPHDFWFDFFHNTEVTVPGILATARSTGRNDFLAFGEVFESPPPMTDALERKVASFLGTTQKPELPSVLQFPLFTEIERVLATGQPTSFMTYRLGKMMDPSLYPDPHILPTFIDNHDVRRFLAITSPTGEDLLQALTFLFTVPGLPVVYYGTEQGFSETRQAMFAGGWNATADAYNTNHAVYQRIKKLAGIRKAQAALRHGGLEVLTDNVASSGPFAFRRTMGTDSVLVILNTAKQSALLAEIDTKLPAGSTLEVLHDEAGAPSPTVGIGGRMTAVLPAKSVIVARPTGATTAPPTPAATITVTTPIAGQTFREDVVFVGTVTPANTRLQVVLDANLQRALPVTVTQDGNWNVTLPVSTFATGSFQHDLAFWAPDARVATPQARFTSDVVFTGETINVTDPMGDDRGPDGAYTYPTDATFGHQMDIAGVKLEVGATTMNLNLTMADFSSVWNPRNGFDHVYFNIFFAVPGQTGAATVMPKLSAQVPQGFNWTFNQFSGGFDNVMYTSEGASATAYGETSVAPTVKVDPPNKTITFTYDRNDFGVADWSGVKIYIATWDFDGIGAIFRPLTESGGQWRMGGGGPPFTPDATDPTVKYSNDPKIMDDLPVITIP